MTIHFDATAKADGPFPMVKNAAARLIVTVDLAEAIAVALKANNLASHLAARPPGETLKLTLFGSAQVEE